MADCGKDRSGSADRCMPAIKEDLAAWMSSILSLVITVETLLEDLETGVVLCRLANVIQSTGEEFLQNNPSVPRTAFPSCGVTYKERTAFRGSFIARDNVANFIRWCRELGVSDVIMFETEDLVLHKNEKSVILTLMEVARISVKFGLEPPDLVRMENEIDQEIEQQPVDEIMEEPMIRLKKQHKSHSLDDLVYQVLDQCTCPVRFPVLRVAEGKYRMGESRNLIFVRVMRKHVMVRVGGGWDTLERYFDKHDPCKVSEKQRRNSVKLPRSRSGSDVIGRSPSSISISSSDSHDSGGLPVSHGRTASWSSSQTYASQLKSPRDPAMKITSSSPTRSPSPSSPRLQHRQRRDTTARDTPPRTIDTQHRGRLSRRSKSMQELTSVTGVDGRSPPHSKPTALSVRKQSVAGQNSSRDSASPGSGTQGQARRRNLAASPRKPSIAVPQGEPPSGRSRLSSSGPVGSNRPGTVQVSRSASFGSRPRPVVPVMEPRSRTMVSSRPTREPQRRASSATPTKSESKDDLRRREITARRRSSSATPQEKARLPGSPKPLKRSAESKSEPNRRPSVSKIPTPKQKQEQQVNNRKPSTGLREPARVHRSLPSTPRDRNSSTTLQNGANNTLKVAPSRNTNVESKKAGRNTPISSRQEINSGNQRKQLGSSQSKSCDTKERNIKINKTDQEEQRKKEVHKKQTDDVIGIGSEDSSNLSSYGQQNGLSVTPSENFDEIDNNSHASDISSPDEQYSQKLTLNGGRKLSGCSLDSESDVTSDILSDFTDTDYDFKSQRYSGLSETSSDFSYGTSPAWKLFNSVEIVRDNLESSAEPDPSELRTPSTLKDCLMNLNLQGSVTPTTKRRIFEVDSRSNRKEEYPSSRNDPVKRPADKALFFDVEHYNEKCPDEDDVTFGSPRKLSLVQSLISSIEKRSGISGDVQRTNKNVATITRSTPVTGGKESLDESGVTQKEPGNYEKLPPFDELNQKLEEDFEENGDTGTGKHVPCDEKTAPSRDPPITYDLNRNISNSEITGSERIPGEKPFKSLEGIDQGFKTRKLPQDKSRRKDKELEAFPRPQRQFTLEEMIEDMMPADTESKQSEDHCMSSPELCFQAYLYPTD